VWPKDYNSGKMSKAVKDFEWLNSHYFELQKTYPNMYVAVRDGKVVAYGREFGKVYDEARDGAGEEFMIDYILSGGPFVLKVGLAVDSVKKVYGLDIGKATSTES
jgi:hypothetical protein